MAKSSSGGNRGGFGGFLRFLFVLGLLGVSGYNTFEVARLRSEVARLEHNRSEPPAGSADSGLAAMGERFLAEARVHTANAQAMAEQHNLNEARKEAEHAATAARSAEATVQTRSARALGGIREAARDLSERANALLTQIKNDAGTARPGNSGGEHVMGKREYGQ